MSTRRVSAGGWVKRERRPCRWCGAEVSGRRLTFCSDACVHEWRLRTDPGYLRAQVFARGHGVCALCGLDTEALRRDKRKLDYRAHRAFEKDWGGRRSLWDADPFIPVVEGGGVCGLSNMRTLCLRCHRAVTAELRLRLHGRPRAGHRHALRDELDVVESGSLASVADTFDADDIAGAQGDGFDGPARR